jgi:glutathione S-transferase
VSEDEIALYTAKHNDPALVSFLRDYREAGPVWSARVEQGRAELARALDELEGALDEAPWLSGEHYGLADISWVVNANRLRQAKVDLSPWPRLGDWADRAIARPAFERAVSNYRP